MGVLPFGTKMESSFLERFKPIAGTKQRIYVLDWTRVCALETHFVNNPDHIGNYNCIKGICCSHFGIPRQTYNFICYHYSGQGYEGQLKVLTLNKDQYESFIEKAQTDNLGNFDWIVSAKDKGRYTQAEYNKASGGIILNNAPEDFIGELKKAVEDFYSFSEKFLAKTITENDYFNMIQDIGGEDQSQQPTIRMKGPGNSSGLQTGTQQRRITGGIGNTNNTSSKVNAFGSNSSSKVNSSPFSSKVNEVQPTTAHFGNEVKETNNEVTISNDEVDSINSEFNNTVNTTDKIDPKDLNSMLDEE